MMVDLEHPQAHSTRAPVYNLHFSEMPTQITRHAPMLGAHLRELLKECRYTDEEIDAFVVQDVIEEADVAVDRYAIAGNEQREGKNKGDRS